MCCVFYQPKTHKTFSKHAACNPSLKLTIIKRRKDTQLFFFFWTIAALLTSIACADLTLIANPAAVNIRVLMSSQLSNSI